MHRHRELREQPQMELTKTPPPQLRTIAVLGATGSVGGSTLDVIARHPDRFRVGAVAARSNWKKLRDICVRFQPKLAAVLEEDAALLLLIKIFLK